MRPRVEIANARQTEYDAIYLRRPLKFLSEIGFSGIELDDSAIDVERIAKSTVIGQVSRVH